jgi:urea transport system permease protein
MPLLPALRSAILLFIFSIFFIGQASAAPVADETEFKQLLNGFTQKSFAAKANTAQQVATSGHPKAKQVLEAMAESRLYFRKSDQLVVFADKDGRSYVLTDIFSNETLGTFSRREVSKVKTNNSLRAKLGKMVAEIELKHPDASVRLAAVEAMIPKLKEDDADLFGSLIKEEQDESVKKALQFGIYIGYLDSSKKERVLNAIEALDGELEPIVRNKLTSLANNSDDKDIKKAAIKSLKGIESKISIFSNLETIYFGISLGSILILAAIGLAITFGVMGVINMAHGELIMLGAYTTYLIQQAMPNHTTASIFLAIPAAFCVSGMVGIAIERGVIRFLYGRPLETLLATFGISLILQQLVRTVISPQNRTVETPAFMSGSIDINPIFALTYNRLYIISFCILVFIALFFILKRTRLGLQVRAVSQNRSMAKAMGVRSDWVDAMTFGLGSGVAGIAGVALSQITNVGPNMGQSYIIDSFMVVVFGGVGNLWGTLVAGLSLGVANKVLEPMAGAVLAKIMVLVFIILFIQKRPRGLFPQKGRAAEA